MDTDRSSDFEEDDPSDTEPRWRVDADASRFGLAHEGPLDPDGANGGRMVYTDENGRQRRLPADLSELSREEKIAAADALSAEVGSMRRCNPAQTMALRHLDRLHASGAMSDEDFERERRRLMNYG